jgi:hypothetical protein
MGFGGIYLRFLASPFMTLTQVVIPNVAKRNEESQTIHAFHFI